MTNTQMVRKEFERTNCRDHRRQPPKGNNYTDPMAQADWEAFQKGWSQALAAPPEDVRAVVDDLQTELRQWKMRANGCKVKLDRALSGRSAAEVDYILRGRTRSGKPKSYVAPDAKE